MTDLLGQETQIGDIVRVLGVDGANILFEITNIDIVDNTITLDLLLVNYIDQGDEQQIPRVEKRLEISPVGSKFLDIINEDILTVVFLGPGKLDTELLDGLQCGDSYESRWALERLKDLWYDLRKTNLDLSFLHCTQLPPAYFSHPRIIDKLKILNLNHNQLRSIPPEIGNLINIETLLSRDNELVYIPPEIGNLINLQKLDLSHNDLKFLPLEIGSLPHLEDLRVEGNNFVLLPGGRKPPTTLLELREAWRRSRPNVKSARKR